MELLQQTYLGNTLLQWSLALGVALFVFLAFQVAKSIAVARLKKIAAKTVTDLDDFAVELLGSTKQILILVLALYAGTYMLELEESMRESVRDLLDSAAILVFLLQAALWGNQVIGFAAARFTRRRMAADDPAVSTIVALMGTVSRIVFFTMIMLVALGSLGFDVTAMITGVGIGGIAVAMAVQGVLSDLFGSLTIALDKPFEVGDFITVGEFKGTVEHVGLKSTRLRSMTGEQLVLGNNDLLSSRVRNFKRMSERRGVIAIGVVYQTSAAQLEAIPGMIKQIIDEQPMARFDRTHFVAFGDFSLNFEIVFWVTSPAYVDLMDTTQAINLDIVRRFEAEGIEFAYPTQTLFVEKEEEEKEKKEEEAAEKKKNEKEKDGS